MKAVFAACLFLALTAGPVLAQATGLESSKSAATAPEPAVSPLLLKQVTVKPDVIEKKRFRFSGPLVRPFKAKRVREVPRRLLHAINPFASSDTDEEFKGAPRVSTRAWTTTVGWSPGASAFADPVTHESSLGLLSIGRSSAP